MVSHELGTFSKASEEIEADQPDPLLESSLQTTRITDSQTDIPQTGLRRKAFLLLNVFLAFHLFAIVICPASVEPSSPLVRAGFRLVSPYLYAIYLDHGFHYFVPDPGASTLVEYSLELPDGSTKTGRFPSRSTYPRLLYHRFFMLSEFLGNGPEELAPLLERAFARNLCRETGATKVTLTRVVHELATEESVLRGMSLNDPSLFVETKLGTYTAEELRLPYEPPLTEPSEDSEAQPQRPKDQMEGP